MDQDTKDESPKTLSIPEAGWRYYRLGRNASYEAAKRGDIPVIKLGVRKKRVPIVLMEQKLIEGGRNTAKGPDDPLEAALDLKPGPSGM